MAYAEILEELYALSPRGIRLGLDRVRRAAGQLGHPQDDFKAIQIAGTNGKGTVAAILAHCLSAAGVKTGLYTSPHLHRFSERMKIDGVEAPPKMLEEHLRAVLHLTKEPGEIPLTFFEVATLSAMRLFAQEQVEIAVLEVGLGGRLDATSIANPVASAITSIGLDHTELLGGTVAEIAREKAAIIRPGIPVFCGRLPEAAKSVVEQMARDAGSSMFIVGEDFSFDNDLLPWPGVHQRQNAALAKAVLDLLGKTDDRLSHKLFEGAIAHVRWPGRFEMIDAGMKYLLDGAHNKEATLALLDALKERNIRPGAVLFGAVEGKPYAQMIRDISSLGVPFLFAKPPIDRAFDPKASATRFGGQGFEDIASALAELENLPTGDDPILVTGSLFTVAEVRRILLGEKSDPPIRM